MENPIRTLRGLFWVDSGLLGSKQVQIALLLAFVVITAGCVGGGDDTGDDDGLGDNETDDPGDPADDGADDTADSGADDSDATGADDTDDSGADTGDSGDAHPEVSLENSVPAGVDGVAFLDGDIVTDQATEELMDGVLDIAADELDPDDPESWDEIRQEAEDEAAFDTTDFESAVGFFEFDDALDADPADEYGGMIVESNWEWDDLVDAADEELDEVETETYNGATVYYDPADDGWAADLGDGTFAFGTEQAVKDVIDTRAGDAEPFSGDLRDAYDSTGDVLMKAAVDVSEEELADDDDSFAPDINIVTMTYNTVGSEISFDMALMTSSATEAEEFASAMNFALSAFAEEPEFQEFQPLFENLQIGSEDNRVTFEYVTTTDEILDFFESLDEFDQAAGGEFNSVQSPALAG